MITHDVLAYAIATEAVNQIRQGATPWDGLFSPTVHITSSRTWPVPDFVVVDSTRNLKIAAEFKPPDQTKREYLTGLGQAVAYCQNFDYSLLVVPSIADDRYPIGDYIATVLQQSELTHLPVGLLAYDPGTISSTSGVFSIARFFLARSAPPIRPATLNNSFYAKWREMSPSEMSVYLNYLFDEARRPSSTPGNIRDRAFNHVWKDLQGGLLQHWGGGTRSAKNAAHIKEAWGKNYRNFFTHILWMETDGRLTDEGLEALNLGFNMVPILNPS